MKIKNLYGRSMRLIHGEGDPNFAEFLKVEGGSQSSPDENLEDNLEDNNPSDDENNDDVNQETDDNNLENDDDDSGDNNEDDDVKPDKTISMLQEQISNLTNLVTGLANKKEDSAPVASEPEINIFDSEEFTNLAEGMAWDDNETALFKTFLSKAFDSNSKLTLTAAMKDLPEIVNSSVTANQTHSEIKRNFEKNHSALTPAPLRKYVSDIASSIVEQNKKSGKQAKLQDVLNLAAEQAYKDLGIKKVERQSKGESRGGKPNPAFPKNRSNSRKPAPKTSKMQNDISAIMSLDN